MKEYYSKKSPKASIIKLVAIQLIFSFVIYYLSGGFLGVSTGLWVAWILILLFVIYSIVKAAQNKPTLIIEKDGITEHSTLNSCGKIIWSNIKNVEIRKGVNMTFLCIDFEDEKEILNTANPVKRLLMKSNKKKLGTICAIPEISLNENLDTILNEINNYRLE